MLVKIIKQPDDPLCCRASIGGDPDIGYYLTFRGNREDVLKALKIVTNALEEGHVPIEIGDEFKYGGEYE
jgi:hypothetical protein